MYTLNVYMRSATQVTVKSFESNQNAQGISVSLNLIVSPPFLAVPQL